MANMQGMPLPPPGIMALLPEAWKKCRSTAVPGRAALAARSRG